MVSHNVYDVFGVLRYQQGSAQTPWRWSEARLMEEELYASRSITFLPRALLNVNTQWHAFQVPMCKPPRVPPYPGPLPGKNPPPKCGKPCYKKPVGHCQDCCEKRCGPAGTPRGNQRIADCMAACDPNPDSDPNLFVLL